MELIMYPDSTASSASGPIELTISDIAFGGDGVARLDGTVYFVPGTCLGERVRAVVSETRSSFRKARLLEVLEPSPDRLSTPDCLMRIDDGLRPLPAAVYAHLSYAEEIRCKNAQLLGFLTRQAGIADAADRLLPPVPSPKITRYRNKTTLHCAPRTRPGTGCSGKILGYVLEDNQTIFDVAACPLSVSAINAELASIREDLAFWRYIRPGDDLVLRWTRRNGAVVYVNRKNQPHQPTPPLLEDTPVLGSIEVPMRGFFQTNPEIGADHVRTVARHIETLTPSRFVDFYSGVGVFGLSMAKCGVPSVVGVDSGADVIRAANQNARKLGLSERAAFQCADVAAAARETLSRYAGPGSCILVDPPRDGLAPRAPYARSRELRVLQALCSYPADSLIYVSCNPSTLARDLVFLKEGGYRLVSATLFDMFPRTAHFETVALLSHTK